MAKKKLPRTPAATPVESIKHGDKRKNISTEKLRDFLPDEPPRKKL